MPDNQYPVFESGQTLTAADLNLLRAFLHERDRLVGRMTGFGINCGLGGVVSGSTLTIQPGLAVDQRGEPLVLPASQSISLAPPAMTPSYDFISTTPGGFSVVIEASDTVEPAPDCGETDCAGHAELHTRQAILRTVAGRVTGTRMDFANEILFTVEPVRLSLDGNPLNSYDTLRNAIATRLTNGTSPLVNPTLIASLQATSIGSGDPPATKGYKAGWLNMVLFATLDLLRVEALLKLSCDRSTTRAGVVLGWVRQVGSNWIFDCSYRHAWEPPRGLTEAFFGGTCTDPAGRYRDELEALLAGYAPPAPPSGGGGGGGVIVIECPPGFIRVSGGDCVPIFYPPPDIPEHWYDPWFIDPLGPIWNPPIDVTWKEPWTIYEVDGWDFFDDGVLGATDLVGRPGTVVKEVLDDHINGAGGLADVKVVTLGEAEEIPGYLPAGGFSPSDSIVLTVDDKGLVVGTGRVAAVRNTRTVGAALPAAIDAAADAQAAATELRGIAVVVEQRFNTLDGKISDVTGGLNSLNLEFQAYKGGDFDQGGFGARLNDFDSKFEGISQHGERLSGVEAKVEMLLKDTTRQETATVKGMLPAVGRSIAQFSATTVAAMKSLPTAESKEFARLAAAAEKSQAQLTTAIATNNPQVIAAAALTTLDTMGKMVKASGVSPEFGQQLDSQLQNLSGLLK